MKDDFHELCLDKLEEKGFDRDDLEKGFKETEEKNKHLSDEELRAKVCRKLGGWIEELKAEKELEDLKKEGTPLS